MPFPSPMYERKSESEVPESCPTLSDLMDCSLPGPSARGIFRVRVLEWVAIAFYSLAIITHFTVANDVICFTTSKFYGLEFYVYTRIC